MNSWCCGGCGIGDFNVIYRHTAAEIAGIHLPAQAELLLIVQAADPLGHFLGPGQRRQQQRGENANDGNHHEQFEQRERLPPVARPDRRQRVQKISIGSA